MGIGSILLGVALFGLVGLFIAQPFLRPQEEEEELTERDLLLEEKEILLDQIQALDFDHDTGKIPTELHTYQRDRLMAQATAVLQAIEALDGNYGSDVSPMVETALDADIEMEAAIARLRSQHRPKAPASSAEKVPGAANGRTKFCPQCGTPTDPGDRFCASCGHNLALKTSTNTA